MKKINFDLIFKIIVFILLTLILTIIINSKESIDNVYDIQKNNEPTEIGRYKDIKIKKTDWHGEEKGEEVLILDTQTGETKSP